MHVDAKDVYSHMHCIESCLKEYVYSKFFIKKITTFKAKGSQIQCMYDVV